MAEATWSIERSAERKKEIEQWHLQVAHLESACRETKIALNKMLVWNTGNGGQGGVEKLSVMSFKKVLPGVLRQFSAIELETSRLFRRHELEQWRRDEGSTNLQHRGRTWYNVSFDPTDARVVDACVGIQEGLVAVQFYVDMWRNASGMAEQWKLYDYAMNIVGSLQVMGAAAAQTATQTPAIQTNGVAATTLAEMRGMLEAEL